MTDEIPPDNEMLPAGRPRRLRGSRTNFSIPAALTEAGVCAYLLTMPFGPALPEIIRIATTVAVLVGVTWGRLGRRAEGADDPLPYRLALPLLLFAASQILSTVFSTDPALSLRSSIYFPTAVIMFLAIQDVARTAPAFRRLLMTLTIVAGVIGIDGAFQYMTGHSLLSRRAPMGVRVSGSLPHPNDMAVIPIVLPLALSLLVTRRSAWTLWLFIGAAPPVLIALATSQSRNSWLGIVVGLVAWGVLDRRVAFTVILLAAGLVLLAAGALLDFANLRDRLGSLLRLPRDGRLGLWHVAWEMFRESPMLGKGAHVFENFYPAYLSRVDLPQGYVPELGHIPWIHNMYLEALAERGIVGLAGLLIVIGGALTRLRDALRRSARRTTFGAWGAGLAASWCVFLTMSVFDLTFLKDWVVLLFWVLAALSVRVRDVSGDVSGDVPGLGGDDIAAG